MPRSGYSTSARSCRSRACSWSARCRRNCRTISCSAPRSRRAIRRRSRPLPSSRRSPRRQRATPGATPAWSRLRRLVSGSPLRCAFLQKGANAFLRSIRRHDIAEILDRVRNTSPVIILAHEGGPRLAHDRRRFRGEISRERGGGRFAFVIVNNLADETEVKSFLRSESATAEEKLESAVTADDAWQMGEVN